MRFGNDWTGVFIRGDNAFYYVNSLNLLVELLSETPSPESPETFLAKRAVQDLVELLASSIHVKGNPEAQVMKEFEECIDEKEAGESEA